MKKSRKQWYNRYNLKVVLPAFLIATGLLLAYFELTNVTHFFNKPNVPAVIPITPTSATDDSSSPTGDSTPEVSSSNDKVTTAPSSGSATSSNLPLYAPYGQFVSNHTPGAAGSPTSEDSVCSTTPGAKCYIKFTKSDGTATQLPSQTIGSDGSTRWSWDAGILSSGSWTITAIATLGEQTKTTQDPTPLTIE